MCWRWLWSRRTVISAARPAAALTVLCSQPPAPRATCPFPQEAGREPLEPNASVQGFSSPRGSEHLEPVPCWSHRTHSPIHQECLLKSLMSPALSSAQGRTERDTVAHCLVTPAPRVAARPGDQRRRLWAGALDGVEKSICVLHKEAYGVRAGGAAPGVGNCSEAPCRVPVQTWAPLGSKAGSTF